MFGFGCFCYVCNEYINMLVNCIQCPLWIAVYKLPTHLAHPISYFGKTLQSFIPSRRCRDACAYLSRHIPSCTTKCDPSKRQSPGPDSSVARGKDRHTVVSFSVRQRHKCVEIVYVWVCVCVFFVVLAPVVHSGLVIQFVPPNADGCTREFRLCVLFVSPRLVAPSSFKVRALLCVSALVTVAFSPESLRLCVCVFMWRQMNVLVCRPTHRNCMWMLQPIRLMESTHTLCDYGILVALHTHSRAE